MIHAAIGATTLSRTGSGHRPRVVTVVCFRWKISSAVSPNSSGSRSPPTPTSSAFWRAPAAARRGSSLVVSPIRPKAADRGRPHLGPHVHPQGCGRAAHRLRKIGMNDTVAAGTFHAQAFAQLRARWADNGVRPPELLDRRGRSCSDLPQSLSRADRLSVIAELDWATARRITPEQYATAASKAGRRPPVTPRSSRSTTGRSSTKSSAPHGGLR